MTYLAAAVAAWAPAVFVSLRTSTNQRQLSFAKFGLAPPEKRHELAETRRARFLERGSPLNLGRATQLILL